MMTAMALSAMLKVMPTTEMSVTLCLQMLVHHETCGSVTWSRYIPYQRHESGVHMHLISTYSLHVHASHLQCINFMNIIQVNYSEPMVVQVGVSACLKS
jgi:hypothetical protein